MRMLFLALYTVSTALAQLSAQVDTLLSAANTPLRKPSALALGMDGLIYIADTGNHRLVALDSLGAIVFESSSGGSAGELRWPVDVTVGATGKVFVADAGNRRIVEFTRLLEWRGELAVTGVDDEPLEPRALAATPTGELYVYERDEGELRCYDNFYTIIARSGSRSGQHPAIVEDICASTLWGVLWVDAQDQSIYRSDAHLSAPRRMPFSGATKGWRVCTSDSTVIVLSDSGLVRMHLNGAVHESMKVDSLEASDFDIAARNTELVFILDTRRGALFRLYWP